MHRIFVVIPLLFLIILSCDECWKTECANGGECRDGKCLCEDGTYRPFCELDTCMNNLKCQNGHCEYGFCICEENWTGESCDSLEYLDHSGEYFGGFECNETTVTVDIIDIASTNSKDTFRFIEDRTGYRYYVGFETRNRFSIPMQKASGVDSEWVQVSGWGRIKSEKIEMALRYNTYENEVLVGYTNCEFDGKKN